MKYCHNSVAHELKTPLAAIKTNIDVLRDGQEKTTADYIETFDIIEKSVVKMNDMIETLLDLVREENASLDEDVYIVNIIEDVVEDLTIIANKNGVILEFKSETDSRPIKGNEILLYRAIYNVVENAIKYNKQNGVVNISHQEDKDAIIIEVKDTGNGIPMEEINKIFEPFYRINQFESKTSKSIGLGLALTQSTIVIHGGEIKVYSEVNIGTTIKIQLPIL